MHLTRSTRNSCLTHYAQIYEPSRDLSSSTSYSMLPSHSQTILVTSNINASLPVPGSHRSRMVSLRTCQSPIKRIRLPCASPWLCSPGGGWSHPHAWATFSKTSTGHKVTHMTQHSVSGGPKVEYETLKATLESPLKRRNDQASNIQSTLQRRSHS